MSDITYSVRAEKSLGQVNPSPTAIAVAQVNATLATARALQQIYDVVKYNQTSSEANRAVAEWVTFEIDGVQEAISPLNIKAFVACDDGQTMLTLQDGTTRCIPVGFGSVALTVGA